MQAVADMLKRHAIVPRNIETFERRHFVEKIKKMALGFVDDLAFHECDRNEALARGHGPHLMDRG